MTELWIEDLDAKHQRELVKRHPGAIRYIQNPSFEISKLVIDKDVDCITNDIKLCERSQYYLLDKYPDMFHLIDDPSQYVIEYALELRPANIQYVKKPTSEQLIKAFSKNPHLADLFVGERAKLIDDYVKSYANLIK